MMKAGLSMTWIGLNWIGLDLIRLVSLTWIELDDDRPEVVVC